MRDSIVKTIFIDAPRETVWTYLIDKDKLALWFHKGGMNLEAGNSYHLLNDAGEPMLGGDVLEMDAPNRLVYTFTHEWLGDAVTTVTWELSEAYGGTKLLMTHAGFDAADDPLGMLSNHDKGWDEHFGRLRNVAATSPETS